VKLGIPDLLFAMGDDGVQEFLIGIQFLPACIMYMGMCPEGAEGTTYAMLTTFSNLAGTIAFDLSTIATKIWDVTTPTLAAGEFQGVFNVRMGRGGGKEGRAGSMMTYKTCGTPTIMRVAGSATSAMRKPQNDKRVRNDEA
jgi:hypothetical protein